MDPRKKKEESLKHDRRNTYGENDKSSRKSIRRRKQSVNRIYRHKVNQVLAVNVMDSTEDNVAIIQRPYWKKSADQPLGDIFLNDLIRNIRMLVSDTSLGPFSFERLDELMEENRWEKPGIRVVIRQLKAVALRTPSSKLDIDLQTARKLIPLLEELHR